MSQESAKEKLNLLMLKEDEVLECILQCTTTTLKFNQLNSKCLLTFYHSLYVIYVFCIYICQVLSILKLSSTMYIVDAQVFIWYVWTSRRKKSHEY